MKPRLPIFEPLQLVRVRGNFDPDVSLIDSIPLSTCDHEQSLRDAPLVVDGCCGHHERHSMSSSTQSQPKHASLLSYLTQEAVGGLSAGILGTVIGFPLDTVKARQQQAVRATPLAETASASAGIVSTARRIVQTEGALALYRGIVPPLLSLSLLNTLNFTSYSYVQRTIHARQSNWDYRNAIAGGCCGYV